MISMKMAKIFLLINGIADVLIGIPLVFLPNFMAELMSYPAVLSDSALYFAGGWGIAAICFGIARIWASFVEQLVWYNVYLGLLEGTILTIFSIISPIIFPTLTYVNVSISLAIASSFMIMYSIALILKFIQKKKEVDS